MKRLSTTSSDEIEPVIKRTRRLISSPSQALQINDDDDEIIIDEYSQSENDDDDFIEIIHENSNSTCQQTDNTIIIISDSDDDLSIDVTDDLSPPLSSIIDTIISPSLDNNVEEDHELIDLTEDDANQLERKSSTDVQQCPICLETFSDLQYSGVYLIITPCRHIMCTLCSRQLLITSSRCPLCREKVHSTTLMPYCILT